MNKIIISSALIFTVIFILIMGCKKNTSATNNNCNINIAQFKDKLWHPVNSIFTDLEFMSNGTYLENGTIKGTWSLKNDCDIFTIKKYGNQWEDFKISSLSEDSCKMIHPIFGELEYYN
jgi:hypothetical protein